MGHVASKNSGGSSKDQRSAAREKVKAMQEAQRRKDRRTRALIISAGVVVAAVLITIAAVAITNVQQENAAKEANLGEVVVPPGATDAGGITVAGAAGAAQAPVVVQEYLDYQCPACKQFDLAVGPYLKDQVAQGSIELEYHPLGFLDQFSSGTRYSTRSANAAFCVAASDGGDIAAFSDTLYAEQPPENASGLPDEDLVRAATDAGAGEDVEQCITGETYSGYVADQSEKASEGSGDGPKIDGTPTVIVDGDVVQNPTLANVQAAVEGATR